MLKIGDRVRIRDDADTIHAVPELYFSAEMKAYLGEEHIIIATDNSSGTTEYILDGVVDEVGDYPWQWAEECLDYLEPSKLTSIDESEVMRIFDNE